MASNIVWLITTRLPTVWHRIIGKYMYVIDQRSSIFFSMIREGFVMRGVNNKNKKFEGN